MDVAYKLISVEEYLAEEAKRTARAEYLGGQVYLMAGGTSQHNRISLNIAAHLLSIAPATCRVYQEGMKLRADQSTFYYPDVMVVCDKEQTNELYESQPCILVEVLSPSTQNIDLREKLLQYKRLPSLQTYLVVDPESYFVRHFWRAEEGWQMENLTGSGEITLPCLGASLSLAQVYRNIFENL